MGPLPHGFTAQDICVRLQCGLPRREFRRTLVPFHKFKALTFLGRPGGPFPRPPPPPQPPHPVKHTASQRNTPIRNTVVQPLR
jgi:hypothetical protein